MYSPLPWPDSDSLKQHPLTWLVIAASLVVYSCFFFGDGLASLTKLLFPLNLSSALSELELWRIWSPTLIHFTVLHLATNAYLFWLFGSTIEPNSRGLYITAILFGSAIPNCTEGLAVNPNFGGLSGLVYCLLGLCISQRYVYSDHRYSLPVPLICFVLLMIPAMATGWFGHYANLAHISGLLCGVALSTIFHFSKGAV